MGLEMEEEDDKELFQWLLGSLQGASIDYTLFFRKLSRYNGDKSSILDLCVYRSSLQEWLEAYETRLKKETLTQEERHKKMLCVNPKYILKNHILQEAINKAQSKDFTMIEDLLRVALAPFDEHLDLEYLCKPTPIEAKNIKLSCSS